MRRVSLLLAASVLLAGAQGCGGRHSDPPPADPAAAFALQLRGTWLWQCVPVGRTGHRERWTFAERTLQLQALSYPTATCGGAEVVAEQRDGTYAIGSPVPQTVDGNNVTAYTVIATFPAQETSAWSAYVDLAPEPDGLFLTSCAAWDCEWVRPAPFTRETP